MVTLGLKAVYYISQCLLYFVSFSFYYWLGAQKPVKRNESGGMVSNTEVERKPQASTNEALESTFTKNMFEEVNIHMCSWVIRGMVVVVVVIMAGV